MDGAALAAKIYAGEAPSCMVEIRIRKWVKRNARFTHFPPQT